MNHTIDYPFCKIHNGIKICGICTNQDCLPNILCCMSCIYNVHQNCETIPLEQYISKAKNEIFKNDQTRNLKKLKELKDQIAIKFKALNALICHNKQKIVVVDVYRSYKSKSWYPNYKKSCQKYPQSLHGHNSNYFHDHGHEEIDIDIQQQQIQQQQLPEADQIVLDRISEDFRSFQVENYEFLTCHYLEDEQLILYQIRQNYNLGHLYIIHIFKNEHTKEYDFSNEQKLINNQKLFDSQDFQFTDLKDFIQKNQDLNQQYKKNKNQYHKIEDAMNFDFQNQLLDLSIKNQSLFLYIKEKDNTQYYFDFKRPIYLTSQLENVQYKPLQQQIIKDKYANYIQYYEPDKFLYQNPSTKQYYLRQVI
ncbi:hypothetical protein PPERSA_03305 [Pseudocohnilembus persalinus]|uniref:Uncharacterized protein n=1 Tax=Pseudocohnilembus persalinus TaxID=266149 RepID=A0A0V0Q8J3_PSEPJ|nr:hypothetical protein PPERSA_03305 [Pseudocohnilembus persalinus]|eukprot:KRW98474.1 hypothetical protein PPERSA_03305 [Pseudocohnilembus persalinus]